MSLSIWIWSSVRGSHTSDVQQSLGLEPLLRDPKAQQVQELVQSRTAGIGVIHMVYGLSTPTEPNGHFVLEEQLQVEHKKKRRWDQFDGSY